MKRLEYILSGTSYTRIHSAMDRADVVATANRLFGAVAERTNHKFGLLYNAFTEPGFGKNLEQFDVDSIHADSGGLQIITQGLTATPEIKDKIYRNQATHANLGMCFDEIPIKTTGATSGRNDTTNRFFDTDNLQAMAKETGRNISRQIEVFLEEKSKCKPILIAQGNCYDTYMKWTECILGEIPKSMHEYIGGVAMGGAALGTGSLEDIERAFIFTQLPMEKKHLHILGVGSSKRLLPYLMFIKNGMYDGVSVSYDSTTHSSGIELGNYYHNGSMLNYSRVFNNVYMKLHSDCVDLSGHDIPVKEFFKVLNTGKMKYLDEGGNYSLFFTIRLSAIMGSVLNFCKYVDKLLESENELNNFLVSNKNLAPIKMLVNVKDLTSYNQWKSAVGRYVKSNRIIAANQTVSIEEFF
jgi:hypothetical protein